MLNFPALDVASAVLDYCFLAVIFTPLKRISDLHQLIDFCILVLEEPL